MVEVRWQWKRPGSVLVARKFVSTDLNVGNKHHLLKMGNNTGSLNLELMHLFSLKGPQKLTGVVRKAGTANAGKHDLAHYKFVSS